MPVIIIISLPILMHSLVSRDDDWSELTVSAGRPHRIISTAQVNVTRECIHDLLVGELQHKVHNVRCRLSSCVTEPHPYVYVPINQHNLQTGTVCAAQQRHYVRFEDVYLNNASAERDCVLCSLRSIDARTHFSNSQHYAVLQGRPRGRHSLSVRAKQNVKSAADPSTPESVDSNSADKQALFGQLSLLGT